jgi:hypothetical protein
MARLRIVLNVLQNVPLLFDAVLIFSCQAGSHGKTIIEDWHAVTEYRVV